MTEKAIRVQDVSKEFTTADGGSVLALSGADLEVDRGEFIAIVGPSGCGKSTLLKLIAGLIRPTSGHLSVHGERVTGPQPDAGIVFQTPLLLPWRTVRENAFLPTDLRGGGRGMLEDRVDELLELVGLSAFADKYPFELSGGMQQRASIARALLNDPDVLLMDEPFGALDAMLRESMNLEIQRIWLEEQNTVCFVTHSIPEAVFLADRVVVMSRHPGRIVDVVSVDFERPRGIDVMGTDEFGALSTQIRRTFTEMTEAGG